MHIHPPAAPTPARERTMKIYAGKLFDPYTLALLPQRVITTSPESGLVLGVAPYSTADEAGVDFADEAVVDLRQATVLPGLVDAHVHRELCVGYAGRGLADDAGAREQCSCMRTRRCPGRTR